MSFPRPPSTQLWPFTILERYVARAYLRKFSLILPSFLGIYLIVDFFEKIDRLLAAHVELLTVVAYFIMKVPQIIGQIMPAAILVAVMITLAILSRHNETIAMKSSGIDILVLFRPLLTLAGLFCLGLLALNLYLIPWSNQRLHTIWETEVEKKPVRSLIKLERFWYKGDRAIYNISMYDKYAQALEGVKIYLFDDQFRLVQLITAQRGTWTGQDWAFSEGFVQDFPPHRPMTGETFQSRTLKLTERPEDFGSLEKKVSEMDAPELYTYIHRLERDKYDSTPYWIDLLSRFASAFTPLVVTLIGGSLVLLREKGNIALGITLGIGIIFFYWLAEGFFSSLGLVGRLPAVIATWIPNALFISGGLILFFRVAR